MNALRELEALEAEFDRRRYLRDPSSWVEEVCHEHVWSKQRDILDSIVHHRRTACRSCYASGKSFIAARAAAWWIANHPPGEAFVVTTASTGSQVKNILWRELNRTHAKADLPGRMNQTEWYLPIGNGEEIVAFGRKPQDMDPEAFQGIHARWVLVIVDEAAGVPEVLLDALEGLISNEDSRMLAIGNPDDASSHFAKICQPDSQWHVIHIPYSVTPNFTDEEVPDALRHVLVSKLWVEEKRESWGEDHPFWIAKVLAEFPQIGEVGLVPLAWVRAAQDRDLEAGYPSEIGVDVGGGGDKSVFCHRRGGVARIIHRSHEPSVMVTAGEVVESIKTTGAGIAKIDEIGIGIGIVDRLKEQEQSVEGVNVGTAPKEPKHFINLRAEAYWSLRTLFQNGEIDIDPEDEDLAAQLVDIRYFRTSSGKVQIESKKDMKRRGKSSPDEADALMLAFCDPPKEKKYTKATW